VTLPAPNPDRTCLVTGASSGIGAAIASLLAARGLGVTLVARSRDKLQALAGELTRRHGIQAEVIVADLVDEESRTSIVAELDARSLSVNVLVNNAGFSTMGPVHLSDPGRELAMVRTDVEAVVHLCSLPGQAAYGASKAFVLSYSHALRGEMMGKGVTVTVLCPGPVETGFVAAAGITQEQAAGAMPKMLWVEVGEVARAAVTGLDAERAVVIPGAANRMAAAAGRLAPRSVLVPMLARRHPALGG
jgi:uncharacterized protein